MVRQEASVQWKAVCNTLGGCVVVAMLFHIMGCSHQNVCLTHDDCLSNQWCDEGVCLSFGSDHDKEKNASTDSDTKPLDFGLPDANVDFFPPETLLEIDIEMSQDDWETLRFEGRVMPRVYAGCDDFSGYTYFDSTVTINGETVEHVAVRKKGFLGALSIFRPSFKINFGRGTDYQDRLLGGEKRFTLNNNKQDLSNVRQCLSYALFSKAGIKAPRCNFAHITAQGKDLGIYSHVEAIKKPFLSRAFGNDNGNLYEGQGSDFNSGLSSTFQKKTNEREKDWTDIEAVVAALKADDTAIWDALSAVVDMDEFLTYWAVEVLVGHWDSYSGNQNNFYIYNDPSDGRFHFIPWGTDGAFPGKYGKQFDGMPKSTYAASELTNRLWHIPALRSRYEKRLKELMDDLWDERALNDEVDRMGKLTGAPTEQLEVVSRFIDERREVIESELGGSAPDWTVEPQRNKLVCKEPLTTTSGAFELTWSDPNDFGGKGNIDYDISIAEQSLNLAKNFYSAAGPCSDIESDAYRTLRIAFGGYDVRGRHIWVGLFIPKAAWAEGKIAFHGYEISGVVGAVLPHDRLKPFARIGDGTITMEKAGDTYGAAVKGSWEGKIVTSCDNSIDHADPNQADWDWDMNGVDDACEARPLFNPEFTLLHHDKEKTAPGETLFGIIGECAVFKGPEWAPFGYMTAVPMTAANDSTDRIRPNWIFADFEGGNFFTVDVMQNGHILGIRGLNGSNMLTEIDPNSGTAVRIYDDVAYSHDAIELPDGNIMAIWRDEKSWNENTFAKKKYYDHVRVIDQAGNKIWDWSLRDKVEDDPVDKNNFEFTGFWSSCTSLDFVPKADWTKDVPLEGDIYLSCRAHNRLYRIDYQSGEIVWIMGRDGDFGRGMFHISNDAQVTFDTDENGQRINTRILMYDNRETPCPEGNENCPQNIALPHCPPDETCPENIGPYSRVIEVVVDNDLNAEIVWKWPSPASKDFDKYKVYSPLGGGVSRLSNGNLLITHATVGGDPYLGVATHGRLIELKRDGSLSGAEVVWDMEVNEYFGSYKAIRVPEGTTANWKPRPIDRETLPENTKKASCPP